MRLITFLLLLQSMMCFAQTPNEILREFTPSGEYPRGFVTFMDSNASSRIEGRMSLSVFFELPIDSIPKPFRIRLGSLRLKSIPCSISDSIDFLYLPGDSTKLSRKEEYFKQKYIKEFKTLYENLEYNNDIEDIRKYGIYSVDFGFMIIPYRKFKFRKYPYFNEINDLELKWLRKELFWQRK